jgi:hypothetical protein
MFGRFLCLLVCVGVLSGPVFTRSAFADDAGVTALQDAGSASAPEPTPAAQTPADKLHDPLHDPKAAVDDMKQAKRQGWAMLAFAIGVIAAKLLGRAKKLPKLAFLNKGRAAIIVGALCAIMTACYNALADGGSLFAAGYAGLLAVAAYWNSHSGETTT